MRETIILGLLTQAVYWGIVMFGSFNTFDAYAEGIGITIIYVVYFPVLVAILLRTNQPDTKPQTAETWTDLGLLPRNWLDATVLSLLLIAAIFLVWLPLVTYR